MKGVNFFENQTRVRSSPARPVADAKIEARARRGPAQKKVEPGSNSEHTIIPQASNMLASNWTNKLEQTKITF